MASPDMDGDTTSALTLLQSRLAGLSSKRKKVCLVAAFAMHRCIPRTACVCSSFLGRRSLLPLYVSGLRF